MTSKLPFFKFDCHDWMTGKIQLCDMKTQGIFINICTMIWCEKGFLKNDRFLHRKLGIEKQVLSDALECFFELGIMEEKDSFLSVDFINQQFFKYQEYIRKKSEAGKKGGRPKKQTKANKKEERREKIVKKNLLTEIPKSKPFLPSADSKIDYSSHVQEWNEFAQRHGLPRVEKLTSSRKSRIKSRLAEGFDWDKILSKISESSFLRGDNNRNWKVFFDWLFVNENNWLKVTEGHYDTSSNSNPIQLKSIDPANYSEEF